MIQFYILPVKQCSSFSHKFLTLEPLVYIYLEITRCVIDSYLDKELDTFGHVELAWYAVFFMRYWRHWLLLIKEYKLSDNFITNNAYMCIELNAHSLLLFLITCRDLNLPNTFLP